MSRGQRPRQPSSSKSLPYRYAAPAGVQALFPNQKFRAVGRLLHLAKALRRTSQLATQQQNVSGRKNFEQKTSGPCQ
ncbi:hypothetical protein BH20VER2_BH20VER2_16870 [soil metagenome]